MLAYTRARMGQAPNRERVALVTGASRGIGRASALALAEAGFDVVLAARTVHEGERFEHSPTVHASDTRPLPGSLDTTSREIRDRGRRALPLRMDLLDRASVIETAERAISEWGGVDLLVNNAVYTGPGNLDLFLDLPVDGVERIFQANLLSQVLLTQRILPQMLERGSGIVINVVSAAGANDPPVPADAGGWGFAYGASKAALERLAGVLAVELRERGVRSHSLEPGFVITETMQATGLVSKLAASMPPGLAVTPAVPAAVVAWLATAPEAVDWEGKTVSAPSLCRKLELLPSSEIAASLPGESGSRP